MFFDFYTRMVLVSVLLGIGTAIYYVFDWLNKLKSDAVHFHERIDRVAERRAQLYKAPANPKVLTPFKIGNLTLKNRFVKAAANEHMNPDELIAHHREFAEGGCAMTIVAYVSVSPDGCTFQDQYHLDFEDSNSKAAEKCTNTMKRLCEEVKQAGGAACAQITHAGNFSDPVMAGDMLAGPIKEFVPKSMKTCKQMSKEDMDRITESFAKTAIWAKEVAGFDAIEIHAGHGYLLSQFISPTNTRSDEFGGKSVHDRVRFPADVVEAVRKSVGPDYPILVKLNVDDGFKGGITPEDVSAVGQVFEKAGASALVGSGGHVGKNGLFMMRGDIPLWVMATTMGSWMMASVLILFQKWLLPTIPFSEAFFESNGKKLMRSVNIPVALIGGVFTLETMERAIDEGFGLICSARALILEPDLAMKIKNGKWTFSPCTVCNRCMADQSGPIYCPLKGKPEEWY